jgi:hypothetical protein
MLNNAMNVTLEQALEDEGAAQALNFGTKDTAEAMAAFLEKRVPRFTLGRHVMRKVTVSVVGVRDE